MKDKIIKLRLDGCTYREIQKILGCSKSTISYHCKNESLSEPIFKNKITDEIKDKLQNDRDCGLTIKELANKYDIGVSTIKKYTNKSFGTKTNKTKNKCLNCGELTETIFCSNKCSGEFIHKETYKDFIENNEKYCRGNYTPKNFKDFFLEEQNNKCDMCFTMPHWNNKKLVFVLDHIDGDASNNKRENLRMICPNCDSQLDTFKSKNKNSTRRNYWKEKIIRELE